ncbi:MAG: hypothetical protein K0S07_1426 [Chlamydiales bacterium]|jgi:hypothetical protein|nr:hypothetical protein [Chlamydiales bacterium]
MSSPTSSTNLATSAALSGDPVIEKSKGRVRQSQVEIIVAAAKEKASVYKSYLKVGMFCLALFGTIGAFSLQLSPILPPLAFVSTAAFALTAASSVVSFIFYNLYSWKLNEAQRIKNMDNLAQELQKNAKLVRKLQKSLV